MATTSCDMPEDIIINILSRLPVKSLMRFRCVCKSWRSLVTDPNFIDTQLNHTRANNDGYVLIKRQLVESGEHRFSLYSDETFVQHTRLEFKVAYRSSFEDTYIRGYCDGLLCLYCPKTSLYNHDIYLWNPAIRKLKVLPDSLPVDFACIYLDFGFVPQLNDYRVVKFLCYGKKSRLHVPLRVHVYSLRTNSWKEIESAIPCKICDGSTYSTSSMYSILNGVVHCVARMESKGIDYKFILSFDMANEVFGEIKLPEYRRPHDYDLDVSAVVLTESLSLFVFCGFGMRLDIWVMKEYGVAESWIKQFTFDQCENFLFPIGFMKNGFVVLKLDDGELVSYDSRTQPQQVKCLCFSAVSDSLTDFTFYTESLLLLNVAN